MPVRLAGVILFLFGLVAVVVGTFNGCGSLFSWNGRHPVEARALEETEAGEGPAESTRRTTQTLVPKPGRRYTVSVQVVFDRKSVPKRDGVAVVDAKMPLVVRVKDKAGTSLAEATGWLDPNEPPNVLYGHAAHESMRGPAPELVVERLVGPFIAASESPLSVEVDLGAERVGGARIVARRLVIYDDALPPSIRNAFVGAAFGTIAFLVGLVLLIVGWWRRASKASKASEASEASEARAARKRGGIPRHDVV